MYAFHNEATYLGIHFFRFIDTQTTNHELVSIQKVETTIIINPRKAIIEFAEIVSRIEEILA